MKFYLKYLKNHNTKLASLAKKYKIKYSKNVVDLGKNYNNIINVRNFSKIFNKLDNNTV